MIVYGDRVERASFRQRLTAIAADIDALADTEPGIARHGALATALIALGQAAQGIADADRERTGADGGSAGEDRLAAPLRALADALIGSWHRLSAGGSGDDPALLSDVAADLRSFHLTDDAIEIRLPEGYAFYSVYLESFAEAAGQLLLSGPPRVIGIRSIGTSLAAVAAAALNAPPPLTVRPVGHPFARTIALTPAAEAALLDERAHYIVVDEGPGLSGSSFAAVAEYLEARGVEQDRISFLPSHGGAPGRYASERTRKRWTVAQRPVVPADRLIPPQRLAAWIEPLIGPLDGPLEDISGGGWRARLIPREEDWPAINPGQERRKFLAQSGGQRWLVKYSGLGGEAERKLARARILHAAGLVPEVRGAVHGFLVEKWIDGTPLRPDAAGITDFAARYLAARARCLPPPGDGASLSDLFAMARHNIALAIGEEAAAMFAATRPDLDVLQRQVHRIATDNRCDAHEWLRLADGRIVKTDALDHDAAHDLIGAQDLAWDIAGVSAAFDLDTIAMERLTSAVDRAVRRVVSRDLLAFLQPCYLAFRLGAAQMAADSLDGWPEEAARNRAAVHHHARRLRTWLADRAG